MKEETRKEIIKEIESAGYSVTGDILNKNSKLNLVCPNGHIRECSYNSFVKYKCRYCENEKKLKELIHSIEENGFTFIKFPKDARSVATTVCENGHVREAKVHNLNNFGCPECVGNVKKDINFCRNIFNERGFTLLEEEYISCKTRMRYICTCGRERETTLDIIQHSNIDSCAECKGKKVSGELAPTWKGGITPENEILRRNSNYRIWRKSVFERDEYTCQCCGKVGDKLRGHHIFSWADNKELRYDINNGITLCNECHDLGYENSFHTLYGAGKNTREQLDEFLLKSQN